MLTIKELTVKNFMSVGNATQSINFSDKNLILVLGENMDMGGDDAGARNGAGKTTIINALSYVFFGEALIGIERFYLSYDFVWHNPCQLVMEFLCLNQL